MCYPSMPLTSGQRGITQGGYLLGKLLRLCTPQHNSHPRQIAIKAPITRAKYEENPPIMRKKLGLNDRGRNLTYLASIHPCCPSSRFQVTQQLVPKLKAPQYTLPTPQVYTRRSRAWVTTTLYTPLLQPILLISTHTVYSIHLFYYLYQSGY